MNLRYPNITAHSEREQLSQVKSYLHQLVDQLNYALPSAGTENQTDSRPGASTYTVQGNDVSYYELRSLIVQQLQDVERLIEQKVGTIAVEAASKIRFILDENGNLYYEVEE